MFRRPGGEVDVVEEEDLGGERRLRVDVGLDLDERVEQPSGAPGVLEAPVDRGRRLREGRRVRTRTEQEAQGDRLADGHDDRQ